MGTYRDYTELEEKINFSTHFVTLIFYVVACTILLSKALNQGTSINIAGLIIYSIGLVSVFLTSSLYHYAKDKEIKKKFRTLDHMAIFLLIGGTYTPVISKYVTEPTSTIFLTILWGLLIVGIFLKFFFMGRFKFFSIVMYVFLGCMIVFLIEPIKLVMPYSVFQYLLWGGMCYLLGIIFYINKKRAYTHSIWHLFVTAGSFLHFIAVWMITFNIS